MRTGDDQIDPMFEMYLVQNNEANDNQRLYLFRGLQNDPRFTHCLLVRTKSRNACCSVGLLAQRGNVPECITSSLCRRRGNPSAVER